MTERLYHTDPTRTRFSGRVIERLAWQGRPAILLDRTALSLRLVAWSAVIVLAVAPESLTSASFQMSFAAVVALIAAWEAAAGWRRLAHRL